MAGSPGAGKTETARAWVKNIATPIVHIDADAVRSLIPGYNGKNASIFQAAATVGVEKLFDHVIDHRQSVILDTTFTPYQKARKNVPKDSFIRQFLEAPKCVQGIIEELGRVIQVDVVRKDIQKGSRQQYFERVYKIEDVVPVGYNRDDLEIVIL